MASTKIHQKRIKNTKKLNAPIQRVEGVHHPVTRMTGSGVIYRSSKFELTGIV